jgi:hypothetical protein
MGELDDRAAFRQQLGERPASIRSNVHDENATIHGAAWSKPSIARGITPRGILGRAPKVPGATDLLKSVPGRSGECLIEAIW